MIEQSFDSSALAPNTICDLTQGKKTSFSCNNEPIAFVGNIFRKKETWRNLSHFTSLLCYFNRMQRIQPFYGSFTTTCAFARSKQCTEKNLWRRIFLFVPNRYINTPYFFIVAPQHIRKTQCKCMFICFIMISMNILLGNKGLRLDRVSNPLMKIIMIYLWKWRRKESFALYMLEWFIRQQHFDISSLLSFYLLN